jgi:hypothetical protein
MQKPKIKPTAFEWSARESKLMEKSPANLMILSQGRLNKKTENLVNPAKIRNYYIPNINPDPHGNTIHHNAVTCLYRRPPTNFTG